MTENDIGLFFILLAITIIPISLYFTVAITKDINSTIKKCDEIEQWAKEELDKGEDKE